MWFSLGSAGCGVLGGIENPYKPAPHVTPSQEARASSSGISPSLITPFLWQWSLWRVHCFRVSVTLSESIILNCPLLSLEGFGNAMSSITGPAWTFQKNAHTRKKYHTKDVNRSLNTGQQLFNFCCFERATQVTPLWLWQCTFLSLL